MSEGSEPRRRPRKWYEIAEHQFITPKMLTYLEAMRPSVILEIRDHVRKYGTKPLNKVAFLYMCREIFRGASIYEIAAGFFERYFFLSIRTALIMARNLIHRMNGLADNHFAKVLSFKEMVKINGQLIAMNQYKRLEEKEQLDIIKTHKDQITEGMDEKTAEYETLIRTDKKKRKKANQELANEIILNGQ